MVIVLSVKSSRIYLNKRDGDLKNEEKIKNNQEVNWNNETK